MGNGTAANALPFFWDIVVAWFGHRVAIWICRAAMLRPSKRI